MEQTHTAQKKVPNHTTITNHPRPKVTAETTAMAVRRSGWIELVPLTEADIFCAGGKPPSHLPYLLPRPTPPHLPVTRAGSLPLVMNFKNLWRSTFL
jgi:hypothetical protein